MIGIIDYGMGNLGSVFKALELVGANVDIIDSPEQIHSCSKLILPGVGAFEDAMYNLNDLGLISPIRTYIKSGRPFLGICLGLQLLFDFSEEGGTHRGLGVIHGKVIRFNPKDKSVNVPHMGWNALAITSDNPLYKGIDQGAYVYFVHSYYVSPDSADIIATTTDYDGPFCSSIRRDKLFATQFHPEKSQRVGLKMLENFAAL